MAKRRDRAKKKPKSRQQTSLPPLRNTGETPAADALTVGWMLAAMTVLLCELALGLVYLFGPVRNLNAVPLYGLLSFSALVIGLIGLGLTPLVYKLRRRAPPRNVTVVAVAICAAPLVVGIWRLLI